MDKIMVLLRISNCSFLHVKFSEIPNIHQTSVRHFSKMNKNRKFMKEIKSVFGSLLETSRQKKERLKSEAKGKISRQKQSKIDTELSWVMKQSLDKRVNLKRMTCISAKQQSECEDKCHTNSTTSPENSSVETLEDKRPSNQTNITKKSSLKKLVIVSAKQRNGHGDTNRTNSANPPENLNAGPLGDKKSFHQDAEVTFHSESSRHTQETIPETTSQSKHVDNNNPHDDASSSDPNATENVAAKPSAYDKIFNVVVKNIQSFSIMGNKREPSAELTETLLTPAKKDRSTIKFPSVTKILTHTMSPESKLALETWKKRMIEQLGQEGFDRYQKALLNDGAALHTCIAHSLQGKEYEIPPKIEPVFRSVQHVLKSLSHVEAIETQVAHTKLRYKGIVDCVASYRGENYVIDWKKSDKKKLDLKGTYDAPVQVAAYIGAINASNLYPFVIKRGLVVIAYTRGDSATVHEVRDDTLQGYWTMWLRRLQQYHVEMASNDNTSNKTLM